jgi:hypothetical protein
MIIVNSLSGGKTSSYMAAHTTVDYNIFSLVRIEADYCKPKDKNIVKYVSDKLGLDFIATAESDKTLYVMRDLEQLLGKEIIWVTGDTFDKVILKKKALPNMAWRFCTTEMKMKPIFEYCHKNFGMVEMNIGFRYDEKERADKENTKFKTVVGKSKKGNRNKWGEVEWRKLNYPLINGRIIHPRVIEWANSTELEFPDDSNCVGCFWKPIQQLRKNWEDEPNKMRWFSEMEQKMKRKFKKEITFEGIKKIGLQKDFFFGTGSGCQSGFCTN